MPAETPELDIEQADQLRAYLKDRAPEQGAIEEIKVLAGGVSNRTVLVQFANGQAWVLKQALAKLRTKADWFSDPARVHREALGIRWLSRLLPPEIIPPFVFEDFDHHILAMQAVPEPNENWKTMLLDGRSELRDIVQFAAIIASIHSNSAGRNEQWKLDEVFGDRTFFESLRLEPYYGCAAEQVPEAREFLHQLIDDTRKRQLALVHGDYSPKNILVHRRRMYLLDHEVIHWGDPAFDVGFALTHMLSKAHFRDQSFLAAADEFWRVYQAVVGGRHWNFETMVVRHTLGCLLARVAGRSPLEYLNEDQRTRQQTVVVAMMLDRPRNLRELTHTFATKLGIT